MILHRTGSSWPYQRWRSIDSCAGSHEVGSWPQSQGRNRTFARSFCLEHVQPGGPEPCFSGGSGLHRGEGCGGAVWPRLEIKPSISMYSKCKSMAPDTACGAGFRQRKAQSYNRMQWLSYHGRPRDGGEGRGRHRARSCNSPPRREARPRSGALPDDNPRCRWRVRARPSGAVRPRYLDQRRRVQNSSGTLTTMPPAISPAWKRG